MLCAEGRRLAELHAALLRCCSSISLSGAAGMSRPCVIVAGVLLSGSLGSLPAVPSAVATLMNECSTCSRTALTAALSHCPAPPAAAELDLLLNLLAVPSSVRIDPALTGVTRLWCGELAQQYACCVLQSAGGWVGGPGMPQGGPAEDGCVRTQGRGRSVAGRFVCVLPLAGWQSTG